MLTLGKPLPDDLLRTIGLITQLTGQIEYELALVIKRSTHGMSLEDCYKLAETRFSRQAIQDEARVRFERWKCDQGQESKFHKILARIDDLANRRGKVTHDCWAYDKETDAVCRNRFGKYVPVNLEDLKDLARDMNQVIADLTIATDRPEFVSVQGISSTGPDIEASLGPSTAMSSWTHTDGTAPIGGNLPENMKVQFKQQD